MSGDKHTHAHMQTNPFRVEEATFYFRMIVSVRLLVKHYIRY